MGQYIPKSALVAEIERRIASLESFGSEAILHDNYPVQYATLVTLKSLKFSIDILEVKEVDLDREMQAFALLYLEPLKISDSNIGISITMAQLYSCAKHFFELGLKAQKGEEV